MMFVTGALFICARMRDRSWRLPLSNVSRRKDESPAAVTNLSTRKVRFSEKDGEDCDNCEPLSHF